MNITIKLWLVAIGFKPTNIYERMIPIAVIMINLRLKSSNLVYNIYADAKINPKKNEKVYAVCVSSR